MNPKSGNPGSPVPPAEPKKPYAADTASPVDTADAKAREREAQAGKYGDTPAPAFHPAAGAGDPEEAASQAQSEAEGAARAERHWVEIELLDQDARPVAGAAYKIVFSDGSAAPGTLDEKGFARLDGVPPGACTVSFPALDKDAWSPA